MSDIKSETRSYENFCLRTNNTHFPPRFMENIKYTGELIRMHVALKYRQLRLYVPVKKKKKKNLDIANLTSNIRLISMRRFNKCPKSQDIFNILLSYFCFILLVWKTHNLSKLTQLSASTLTRILVYCSPHRWYYLEDNSTRLKSFNKDLISNSLLWVLSPGFPTSPWMNNRLSKSMFSKIKFIFHFSQVKLSSPILSFLLNDTTIHLVFQWNTRVYTRYSLSLCLIW